VARQRVTEREVWRLADELELAAERARKADLAMREAQDQAEQAHRAWVEALTELHKAKAQHDRQPATRAQPLLNRS
jgi:hypothetical protein